MDFLSPIISKLSEIQLTIPSWHLLILVFVSSLFMLMGRFRFVLLAVYIFSFIWIFVLNEVQISKVLTSQPQFTAGFIITGALLIGMSIWSFFIEGD
jgi:hypothetical protein